MWTKQFEVNLWASCKSVAYLGSNILYIYIVLQNITTNALWPTLRNFQCVSAVFWDVHFTCREPSEITSGLMVNILTNSPHANYFHTQACGFSCVTQVYIYYIYTVYTCSAKGRDFTSFHVIVPIKIYEILAPAIPKDNRCA